MAFRKFGCVFKQTVDEILINLYCSIFVLVLQALQNFYTNAMLLFKILSLTSVFCSMYLHYSNYVFVVVAERNF